MYTVAFYRNDNYHKRATSSLKGTQPNNSGYLNIYICFLFEQSISDYQQKLDLESSLQMQIETLNEPTPILIKNESFKITYNEIACDFANFFTFQ